MALDKPLFVGDREAVKKARMRFASDSMRDGMCDWLADLAALDARDACVSPAAARDVRTTVRQLRDALRHTGLVEPSKNATSPMVLKALVCAGLMPNIVRVRMPRPKYTEMIGGTVSKDHEAREVAFYAPTLSSSSTWKAYDFSKDRRVFVHPQSTLFAATKYRASPFVVYFAQSASDNSRTYLRDATVPGLYALLMFGPPPLTVDHEHRVVGIGASGALSVRAWPRIAVLATSLRALLDELLRRKLDTPGDIVLAQHPVVQTVLQLIETDGQ
ncbi:helicase [Coemansia sp. BCRC 34301]|nr:helicase [Coemansia sp. BCRC 34301]